MSIDSDIDIDFADRKQILKLIDHTPARMRHKKKPRIHNSGIYIQKIPTDPMIGCSSLEYKEAERRGYFKLDFLNVAVYTHIKNNAHYKLLLKRTPPWKRLSDQSFTKKIIHISNHVHKISGMMPDSIPRMAMFLAILRPGKQHLIGKSWEEIGKTVWDKTDDDQYTFKKSHSIAYAKLVALHMNIVDEN